MATDAAQEARWAVERRRCYLRFCAAVTASCSGRHAVSMALIARVRRRFGEAAAECAGAELRAAIRRRRKERGARA